MYKDNSLIPTEAVRLAALGLLTEAPRSYAALADEVRHFTSRIVGPSLDVDRRALNDPIGSGLPEASRDSTRNRPPPQLAFHCAGMSRIANSASW